MLRKLQHQLAVLLARERERHRGVVGRARGALEHDPLVGELVDEVRLRHALRHVDLLVEERAHGRGRVDREVAAELARVGRRAPGERGRAACGSRRRQRPRCAALDAHASRRRRLSRHDRASAAARRASIRRARHRCRWSRPPPTRAGRSSSPTCCLADVGQPKLHTPEPDAAAGVSPDEVAAPAERVGAALHDPRVAAGAGPPAPAPRSARARRAGSTGRARAAVSASRPKRSPHIPSTGSGVRKHVPELIIVVPPDALAERQHDRHVADA